MLDEQIVFNKMLSLEEDVKELNSQVSLLTGMIFIIKDFLEKNHTDLNVLEEFSKLIRDEECPVD